jgi:hypothetical protein
MSSGATRATGPAKGAKVGPAALASDLDEPVVVGERAPAVGAAGADASLDQQRAERAGEAWAMLGKKGAPSLFKFGFEGACIRVCAAQGCGLLEFGLAVRYANQCWRGYASGRALCGVVGCSSSSWWRCNQCWRGRASGRGPTGYCTRSVPPCGAGSEGALRRGVGSWILFQDVGNRI